MQKVVPASAILVPDSASKVFTGEIFDVYQWQQKLYDGSSATFEMVKRPDTTSVICVVDDKVLVLDEEQPGRGKRRNFPGGRVDAEDADIISAAQREVLEETGYRFANWRLIKVWQPIAKLEWFVHLVLAWDMQGSEGTNHEPGERIVVEHVSLEQLRELFARRESYLEESAEFFEHIESLDELQNVPEFLGRVVDR